MSDFEQLPDDLEIVAPQDVKLEKALQLLAIFIRRFGDEVVITQREFDLLEGVDVLVSQIDTQHLKLRLHIPYDEIEEG